jgi:hypothetical protein
VLCLAWSSPVSPASGWECFRLLLLPLFVCGDGFLGF